jgi:hypothetical protein
MYHFTGIFTGLLALLLAISHFSIKLPRFTLTIGHALPYSTDDVAENDQIRCICVSIGKKPPLFPAVRQRIRLSNDLLHDGVERGCHPYPRCCLYAARDCGSSFSVPVARGGRRQPPGPGSISLQAVTLLLSICRGCFGRDRAALRQSTTFLLAGKSDRASRGRRFEIDGATEGRMPTMATDGQPGSI